MLKKALPILSEKFGDDQELDLEIEFRRPRVTFGKTERDMFGTVTLKFGVKIAGDMNYVFYDEIDIYVEGDMSIDQEVFIGSIETLSASKAKLSDTTRTTPIYDTLNMSEEEYTAFWEFTDGSTKRW